MLRVKPQEKFFIFFPLLCCALPWLPSALKFNAELLLLLLFVPPTWCWWWRVFNVYYFKKKITQVLLNGEDVCEEGWKNFEIINFGPYHRIACFCSIFHFNFYTSTDVTAFASAAASIPIGIKSLALFA